MARRPPVVAVAAERRAIDAPDPGGIGFGDADDVLGVTVVVFATIVLIVLLLAFVIPVALALELIALRSGRVRDEAAAALPRGEAQVHPPEALAA